MLDSRERDIAYCLKRAAECEKYAEGCVNSASKDEFLEISRRWRLSAEFLRRGRRTLVLFGCEGPHPSAELLTPMNQERRGIPVGSRLDKTS
jgi:hypothetical protein